MKNLSRIKIYFVMTLIATVALSVVIVKAADLQDLRSDLSGKLYRNALYVKYSIRAIREAPLQIAESHDQEQEQAVPVIVYHGIEEENPSLPVEIFEDQMFALKREGYNTITTEELYLFLRGQQKLPPKPILITFDDGRSDNLAADPILRALGYKATIFLIGSYTKEHTSHGNYYLSADQVRSMHRSGTWDIQAHSHDGHVSHSVPLSEEQVHFFGNRLWLEERGRLETNEEFRTRITDDMRAVKAELEGILNSKVKSFAYPFGDFGQTNAEDPQLQSITLETTAEFYDMAFYQQQPGSRYNAVYFDPDKQDDDLFLLKRINVPNDFTGAQLVTEIRKSELKQLPYTDNFETDRGWVSRWGIFEISPNDLHLEAEPEQTGADVVLDGSQLWTNYTLRATVNSPNQTGVYILMRYENDSNYAGCNFSNGFIFAEEFIDGVKSVRNGVRSSDIVIPEEDFAIEGTVKDRTLECTLGEHTARTDFLATSTKKGGVGFKIWDEQRGLSEVHVKSITATNL